MVFKHEMITWEWAVVVVATILFFAGIEAWKFAKRIYFRRTGGSRSHGIDTDSNEMSDAEKGGIAAANDGRIE